MCLEVNPTSNDFLVKANDKFQLMLLIKGGFRIVLATDNDGIWPCKVEVDGNSIKKMYNSVVAEFAASIRDEQIGDDKVDEFIKNGRVQSFETQAGAKGIKPVQIGQGYPLRQRPEALAWHGASSAGSTA